MPAFGIVQVAIVLQIVSTLHLQIDDGGRIWRWWPGEDTVKIQNA
jgi:hypothetical protein